MPASPPLFLFSLKLARQKVDHELSAFRVGETLSFQAIEKDLEPTGDLFRGNFDAAVEISCSFWRHVGDLVGKAGVHGLEN